MELTIWLLDTFGFLFFGITIASGSLIALGVGMILVSFAIFLKIYQNNNSEK